MESALVIKVNFGDTLRRFNTRVDENGNLDLDMVGLKAKIFSLFSFPFDADLTLTYVDEDGDVVALVDDDDLRDVMRQNLKFLRINVSLNNEKSGRSYVRSSGSSTPLRSPYASPTLPNINAVVSEALKSVPEPLREVVSKLSLDLASKAASSTLPIADVIESFTKMGQSYLNTVVPPQVRVNLDGQDGASVNSGDASMAAGANFGKDESVQEDVKPKCTSEDLSSRKCKEVITEDLKKGGAASAAPVHVPIDLNADLPREPDISVEKTKVQPQQEFLKEIKKKLNESRSGKCFASSPGSVNTTGTSHTPFMQPMSFSGIPGGFQISGGMTFPHNSSIFPPNSSMHPGAFPRLHPFKRSSNYTDAMGGMFHKGVRCDGCGVHPITGPRYKSKVKEDYDLCSICFAEMGNATDYMRIDRPVSYGANVPPMHVPPVRPCKGSYEQNWEAPSFPNELRGGSGKFAKPKLDSRFVSDITVMDGTVMAPSIPFTKIWRMRNSGNFVWLQGTQLVWIGGDKFSETTSVNVEIPAEGVPIDGEMDIAVDFIAPDSPGRYISYWRMQSPSGHKFGQRVWVLIQVDASLKDLVCDSLEGLNLNLLPTEGDENRPSEIIDMNVQPAAGASDLNGGENSNMVTESVKPADELRKEEQELNFPINDTLLVGQGAAATPPAGESTPISYPKVDAPPAEESTPVLYPKVEVALPEAVPVTAASASAPPPPPPPAMASPAPSRGVGSDAEAVEMMLLKELEEMGFKQVDLNKEILRMNGYNFEQSLDALCGVAEWDPILEELEDMGFCDKEMNKKLLKKNNGSIKRVVMDLLTGEKA